MGTTTFLNSTSYFDERGAAVQHLEDNQLSGLDITTLQYHFDGRVMSSFTDHTAAGTGYSSFSVLTKNNFDKLGRVTSIDKRWGANAFLTIAEYSYDDMGRLKAKRLAPGYTGEGKPELEILNYSYNLHNLLTGINKDYALKTGATYSKWDHFFGLYLGYDDATVFAAKRLNGQVSGALWNTQGDDAQRKYDYGYDGAGRLSNAAFKEKKTTGDTWSNSTMDFSVSGTGGKIGYDLNGNLKSMIQKGVTIGGTAPVNIDDLTYTYGTGLTNKVTKVTDASPLGANNGKAGDFKDGSNGTADDYVYDANGNLVIDLNKGAKDLNNVVGANGIRYNYLDKPEEIRIAGKGVIKFVYDAEGSKLKKTFTSEGSSNTVTTTYASGFVYQETVTGGVSSGIKLQYFSFEEGRIRPMQLVNQNNGYDFLTMDGNLDLPEGKRGAIDYFIRDYQENVRMILTEEAHIGSNQCTMETGSRATTEEPLFGQSGTNNEVVKTRFAVNSIPGQTSGGGWQGNSNLGAQVSRIGALAASKVGPNALLKVMSGDRISSQVDYYYQSAVTNGTGNNLLAPVLNSLIQSLSGSPVVAQSAKDGATGINNNLGGSTPFASAVAPNANDATGNLPKAYLNILFFNERFEFVAENSTAVRVQGAGSGQAPLQLLNIQAPKNGYCYVYLSNEAQEMVYFDNFKVTHNRGRIVEENHYYAYGLKIAAISSEKLGDVNDGTLDNKHLYNDKELIDDADLGWYDYGFRNYDPQIGRFPQLDPLTHDYPFLTPYQYASCDPIANTDMDGLEAAGAVGKAASGVAAAADVPLEVVKQEAEIFVVAIVKRTGQAVNGHALYKVIRTFAYTVQASNVADELYKSVATRAVADGVNSMNSRPVTEASVLRNINFEIDRQIAIDNMPKPEFHQARTSSSNTDDASASTKSDPYLAMIRQDNVERVNNRVSNGWPLIGNLFSAGGHAMNGNWNEAWQSTKGLTVETAASLIPFRIGNLIPRGSGRVFWSGGQEAMNAAMDYAKANGMTTLEMTRAGQNLIKLTDGMPWEKAAPMWERLSAAYAKGATGSIHVFHNATTGIRLASTWRKIEYPILKAKNEIIFHNIFTP